MSEVEFNLEPVKEKPSRRYRKGSKYDTILDAFIEGAEDLVEVSVEGREVNYIRMQLGKRIEVRRLKGVKVSIVNNVCYLEKV